MGLRPVGARTRSLLGVTLALVASSCAHHAGGSGAALMPTLSETAWRIEDVGGSGVADASRTELRFAGDSRVSGSTGCNNFTGTATIEGTHLAFSPLATTRRACEEALMEQERRILDAMQLVKSFSLSEDGRLGLLGADGKSLLRLTRMK